MWGRAKEHRQRSAARSPSVGFTSRAYSRYLESSAPVRVKNDEHGERLMSSSFCRPPARCPISSWQEPTARWSLALLLLLLELFLEAWLAAAETPEAIGADDPPALLLLRIAVFFVVLGAAVALLVPLLFGAAGAGAGVADAAPPAMLLVHTLSFSSRMGVKPGLPFRTTREDGATTGVSRTTG